MSDLSNIVDKATDAIVNGQTLSTENLNDLAKIFYASANRIIEAIDKSAGLHREIVQQLPTQDIDDNTIYMVLDPSASGSDIYDEWMWIESAWEHIGSTRVDLSDYYNKTQVDTALSGKADVSDIPTELSDLTADSTHRLVSDTEKSTWNGKSNFSGSYNDLSNKPTIPTPFTTSTKMFYNDSAFTVNANSYKEVIIENITRQGYTEIAIAKVYLPSSLKLAIQSYYLDFGQLFVRFFNPTSSSQTCAKENLQLAVLYSKN